MSPTYPYNMVNFSPLALVWGTPANFIAFRVLAALLHGALVVGVSQTAALNRWRHLYSAGQPSRWAFAHISSYYITFKTICTKIILPYLQHVHCCFPDKPYLASSYLVFLLHLFKNYQQTFVVKCHRTFMLQMPFRSSNSAKH